MLQLLEQSDLWIALVWPTVQQWDIIFHNTHIMSLVEGDDESQRVGCKIWLVHIDFAVFAKQQANTPQAVTLSFELIQWKQYCTANWNAPPGLDN